MQFDETTYTINNVPNTSGWYLTGASNLSNTIFPVPIVSIGVGVIGEETGTTFLRES